MTRVTAVVLACSVLAPSACGGTLPSDQSATRIVLFALQRSERLHAFDAETLQHLGHFVTGPLGDSLGARADGRRLFLLQPSRKFPNACCSLQTIDLATREMCQLDDHAAGGITVEGGLVTSGTGVFDAQTLKPIPVPRGRWSAYLARPSADGRYTARIDRLPGPVLVFTSTATRTTREIPIPEDARQGDWVGDRYVLVAAAEGKGRLWAISPTDTTLPAPRAVILPDGDARLGAPFTLGTDLVSYQRFGRSLMLDRRNEGPQPVPGGALVIPSAGGKARRIAKDIYFTALVPGRDGRSLYAVEAGPHEGPAQPVRLLRLDARTGKITTSVVLNDAALFPHAAFDVWSLALATVPETLVPRGQLRPAACLR